MGNLKKYEAHTRYPCCCCALDVKALAYGISVVGLVFSLTASLEALLFYNTPFGFLIALFYTLSFWAIIFGEASQQPRYLTIFLMLNGTCIVLHGLLVFVFSIAVFLRLDQLNFHQHYLEHNKIVENLGHYPYILDKTYQLSMLLVWMILLLAWLVNVLLQGIIFHAYRSIQLRKKLEYRPYDKTTPISYLSNGSGVGGLACAANNYISTIKRPVFGI